MDRRIIARISGRVQGVGFRYFTRQTARRLDLAGWVRNEPDGSVGLEAEGPSEHVDELLRILNKGPTGSRVLHVAVQDAPPTGDTAPFEIRR